MATYWIFQYLIKTPMLEVLPDGAYARWRRYSSPADSASVRQWILVSCGLLAGAVTHLVWDAFTHENARGVRMIPWLEEPVVEIGTHHMGGIRLLQDGSSLIGLAVVLALVCYGLRRGREHPVPSRPLGPTERRAWVLTYVVATIALTAAWLLWARVVEPRGHSIKALATGTAVAALRGLAAALVCASLGLDWRLRALRRAGARRPP
jgi:hypothetical protein